MYREKCIGGDSHAWIENASRKGAHCACCGCQMPQPTPRAEAEAALRSRIEALANRLASTMTVTDEDVADLRTVLALLAGPGEEEVRQVLRLLPMMRRHGLNHPETELIASTFERLAVRLEAEKRAREDCDHDWRGSHDFPASFICSKCNIYRHPGAPDDRE